MEWKENELLPHAGLVICPRNFEPYNWSCVLIQLSSHAVNIEEHLGWVVPNRYLADGSILEWKH